MSRLNKIHQKILFTGIGERTQTLIRGLNWTLSSAALARVVSGLTTIFAARIMGPAHYGEANLALAIASWIQIPLFLGLPIALLHFTPKSSADAKKLWLTDGLKLLAICGIITLGISYVFRTFWSRLQGVSTGIFNLGLLWSAGYFVYVVGGAIFNSQEQFLKKAASELLFVFLFPLFIFVSYFNHRLDAGHYIGALTFGYVFTGLLGMLTLHPHKISWLSRVDRERSVSLVGYGLIASIGALVSALFNSPARLIANHFLTMQGVGVLAAYQAGSVQMGLFFLGVLSQVFFPIASRTPNMHMLFLKLGRMMVLGSLPLTGLFFGILKLYFLLLGKRYPIQMSSCVMFSAAATFSLYHGIFSWFLAAIGRRAFLLNSCIGVAAGLMNCLACWRMIPSLGIFGAGLAAATGAVCGVLGSCWIGLRETRLVGPPKFTPS